MRLQARHARELVVVDEFARALATARSVHGVAAVLLERLVDLLGVDEAALVEVDGSPSGTWTWEQGRCVHTPGEVDAELVAGTSGGGVVRSGGGLVGATPNRLSARPASAGASRFVVTVARRGRDFSTGEEETFTRLILHAGLAFENVELLDQLRRETAAAQHLARHDQLTGLSNRARFFEAVSDALGIGACSAVLLIDLDRFKEINDTLGHHNGDVVLEEVARRLSGMEALSSPGDLVARLGGDEFAVLLGGPRDEEEVRQVVAEVLAETGRGFSVADVEVDVGASIGVAVPAIGLDDPADILRRADVAMYSAKAGHEGASFYTVGLDTHSPQRLSLVPRFRAAIEAGELTLYFQPQVDLATGEVLGVEALLRWPQAGEGFISPTAFIPVAEQTDLIGPLTRRLLVDAVQQTAEWHRRGWNLRTSVNLSARNLAEPDLADHILHLVAEAGLPGGALCVEVTETAVMTQPDRSRELLSTLKDHGIEVAIDDFGTGHSSLAYLTSLPAGELKIDRSFVMALGEDPAAESVVLAVVGLGLNLGMEIVAEGVETSVAASILTPMGCQAAQGFLYGRAMSPAAFAQWFAEHQGGDQRRNGRGDGHPSPAWAGTRLDRRADVGRLRPLLPNVSA